MEGYCDYRIIIKPTGPIGTPWQSDTLFGHFVWLVAMQEGKAAVQDFLEPFLDREPPFILSDGFPENLLPSPFFDAGIVHFTTMEDYRFQKKVKKARFLPDDRFDFARKEGRIGRGLPTDEPYYKAEMLHASLNRNTNSTCEGGQLFSTVETYLEKKYKTLSIYVRCRDEWCERVSDFFERLSLTGYGRDKSTGIGSFSVEAVDEWRGFAPFDEANGFISLSSYVPDENDPIDGRWRIRVKRGYLGEQSGSVNPFKRPLIQFEPGATFKTDKIPKPWYGRMVRDIAPGMPEAVQNCYTIAVPARL